ncbi:XRE family transcriptional regulator [Oecophyllibacter saccharovorans]|uniref:XRE family transcriptional regulator n=1 Tax=Oecophyllibacter saccharovorans TaxID=2558360 RepID=UPI001171C2B0|nr:XRE family transcriptional regulator [Oecophyllibacter saccharovorans]TPW35220.1 ImmA/IrrE family metallo-endopeptidase [Oecophyllibacter saccharovorans]
MAEAFINHRMLSWAAERSGMSVSEIADSLKVKIEEVYAWFEGQKRPSFSKAQAISKKLEIPFAYLYLASPPSMEPNIPDLRTLNNNSKKILSNNSLEVIKDAEFKQSWYKEYIISNVSSAPLPFVGKYKVGDISIVSNIKEKIGEDLFSHRGKNSEEFIRKIILSYEEMGVSVLKSSIVASNSHRKIPLNDLRGFALSDLHAPFIFINSSDEEVGQIFTLFHELVHIWLGESGISDFISDNSHHGKLENFCNLVAGKILVSSSDLKRNWIETKENIRNIEDSANALKVSRAVILKRARDEDYISREDYNKMYKFIYGKKREKIPSKSDKGGNFYYTLPYRNGRRLTKAVISLVQNGDIGAREASQLLNINISKVFSKKLQRNILEEYRWGA